MSRESSRERPENCKETSGWMGNDSGLTPRQSAAGLVFGVANSVSCLKERFWPNGTEAPLQAGGRVFCRFMSPLDSE